MGPLAIPFALSLPFSLFLAFFSRLIPFSHPQRTQLVAHPRVLFLDEDWPVEKELDIKICAEREMGNDWPRKEEKKYKTELAEIHLVRQKNEKGKAEQEEEEQFNIVRFNESCFTLKLNKPLEADPPFPSSEFISLLPISPSFSLLFEQNDTGDHASVQVQLVDVNDNSPRFLGGPFPAVLFVPENSSPGLLLRRLEVVDLDKGIGGICHFSLERTPNAKGTEESGEKMFELDMQQCTWPRCWANLRLKRRMTEGELVKVRVTARDGAGMARRANEATVELEMIAVRANDEGGAGEKGPREGGERGEKEREGREKGERGGKERDKGREGGEKGRERDKGRKGKERGGTEERDKGREKGAEKMLETKEAVLKGENEENNNPLEEKSTSAENRMTVSDPALTSLPSSAFAFSSLPCRVFLIDSLSEDSPDGLQLLRLVLPSADQPFHFVLLTSNGSSAAVDGLRMFANHSVHVKGPLDAQKTKEIIAEIRRMENGDEHTVAVIKARIWPMMDQFGQWADREIPQNGLIEATETGTGRWIRVLVLPEELYKYAHVVGGEGVKLVGRELVVEDNDEEEAGESRGEEESEGEERGGERKGEKERDARERGGEEERAGGEKRKKEEKKRGGEREEGVKRARAEKEGNDNSRGMEGEKGKMRRKEEKGEKEGEIEGGQRLRRKKCFELELRFRNQHLRRSVCVLLPPRDWLLRLLWPPSAAFRLSFSENSPLPPILFRPNVRVIFPSFAFPSFSLLSHFSVHFCHLWDSAKFRIDPITGQLSLANLSRTFDFETQSSFSVGVSVCVSTEKRRSGCQQFVLSIEVEDTNDHCPKFEQSQIGQTVNISEDFLPSLTLPIAHFARAIDDDGTEQWRSVCYRLANSFGQTFAIPNAEKAELFLTKVLDKETVASYELQIEADDCPEVRQRCAGPSDHSLLPPPPPPSPPSSTSLLPSSFRLVVFVSDVNDNPPRFVRRHFFVPIIRLTVKRGDALVRLRADDLDEIDQRELKYDLGKSAIKTEDGPIPVGAIPFHLHGITGELSIKDDFDESVPFLHSSYTFPVFVRDSGAKHEDSSIVTVSVLDPSVHIALLNFGVASTFLVDQLDLLEQLLSVAMRLKWRVLNQQLSHFGTNCSRMSAYFLTKGTLEPIDAAIALNELRAVPKKGNNEQKMALKGLIERFGLTTGEKEPNSLGVPFPLRSLLFSSALPLVLLLSASFVLLSLIFLLFFIFPCHRWRGKKIGKKMKAFEREGTMAENVFWCGPKSEVIATEKNTTEWSFGKRKVQKMSDHFLHMPQMYDDELTFSVATLPLFIPRVKPPKGQINRTEF